MPSNPVNFIDYGGNPVEFNAWRHKVSRTYQFWTWSSALEETETLNATILSTKLQENIINKNNTLSRNQNANDCLPVLHKSYSAWDADRLFEAVFETAFEAVDFTGLATSLNTFWLLK